MKNPRTLAQIAADPRVESIHDEGPNDEGGPHDWWLYLTHDYVCPHMECGTIHENTVKDCADLLRTVITRVQWERDQKVQNERWQERRKIPTFKLEHDSLVLRSRIVDGISYYLTPYNPARRRKLLQAIRFVATVDGESKVFGSIQADDPINYVVIPRVDTSGSGSDPVRLPAPADLLIFEVKFACRSGCWSTPSYFISLAAAYDWLVEQYNGPYGPVSNGGE